MEDHDRFYDVINFARNLILNVFYDAIEKKKSQQDLHYRSNCC